MYAAYGNDFSPRFWFSIHTAYRAEGTELGVYSEIHPFNFPLDKIRALKPAGIILSGGPASVYEVDAPKPDFAIFDLGIPILGICYGLQLISEKFDGK